METLELLALAESLAKRYRSGQEYQDLIQEGLLAALDHEDQTYWAVHTRMRKAMSRWTNITVATPLSMPPSVMTKKLLTKAEDGLPLLPWERATVEALTGLVEATGDRNDLLVESSEDIHISNDQLQAIFDATTTFLTEKEGEVVRMLLTGKDCQASIAKELGVGRSTVSRRLESAVYKIKEKLG